MSESTDGHIEREGHHYSKYDIRDFNGDLDEQVPVRHEQQTMVPNLAHRTPFDFSSMIVLNTSPLTEFTRHVNSGV